MAVDPTGQELINTRRGGRDLFREKEFGDAIIEVEVMVPRGSNSGIYIMGEYEIQVCDSYGREKLTPGDMGAIYSAAAPARGLQGTGRVAELPDPIPCPCFDADGKKVANATDRRGRARTTW